VTITGSDGSSAVIRVLTTVSHPPDVATTATGCQITAMVEDESEVALVELHWVDGRTTMQPSGPGYVASLPPGSAGKAWSVAAKDALGNVTRTPDSALPPGTC
jgi:hypothetical protein